MASRIVSFVTSNRCAGRGSWRGSEEFTAGRGVTEAQPSIEQCRYWDGRGSSSNKRMDQRWYRLRQHRPTLSIGALGVPSLATIQYSHVTGRSSSTAFEVPRTGKRLRNTWAIQVYRPTDKRVSQVSLRVLPRQYAQCVQYTTFGDVISCLL